jgi:NDP-sugar pyrophosphorylase family protein
VKAVVLAGGKGSRLAPFTKFLPKALIPINDRPILEILLKQMKNAGIEEAILSVGHMAELLRTFFGEGQRIGLKLSYSLEDRPLGTAGPLALVPDLTETFVVANCDLLTSLDLNELRCFHEESRADATIAVHTLEQRVPFGVLEFGQDDLLADYVEKPVQRHRVSMGMYVFEPSVLDFIQRGERIDIPDLIRRLLQARKRIAGYRYEGYWRDLGNVSDYEEAVREYEALHPAQ